MEEDHQLLIAMSRSAAERGDAQRHVIAVPIPPSVGKILAARVPAARRHKDDRGKK